MNYTATFTPTASSNTNGTIDVAGSTFTDAAGNNNTAATQRVITVDTLSPTVTSITFSDTTINSTDTPTVTIILSEAASGSTFDNSDVTTPNGTLGTLTTGDNITWTATFTPSASTTDTTNIATV